MGKGVECRFKGVGVKSSETFIQKESVDADVFTCHGTQPQSQCQRDLEPFTAGKVDCGPDFIPLPVVDDVNGKVCIIGVGDQFVTAVHALLDLIGSGKQMGQRDLLGYFAELAAVTAAGKFIQFIPQGKF